MTCYDVRFPELARALAADGADMLVLPAAWAAGTFKEEHWVTLVRARAIENTIWVAAAGQVPDPAEPPTKAPTGIGRSLLVDPMGVVRLDLGPAEGLGIGERRHRADSAGAGGAAVPGWQAFRHLANRGPALLGNLRLSPVAADQPGCHSDDHD